MNNVHSTWLLDQDYSTWYIKEFGLIKIKWTNKIETLFGTGTKFSSSNQ